MRAVCGLDVHKDTVYLCILCETGEIFENVYGVLTCELKNMCREMRRREVTEVTIYDIDWSGRYPYYNYVLANGKFNRVDDETPISAYQAYLQVTTNVALDTETISIEFVDMGDMNNDKKVTITDAIMILDQILTNQ